MESDIEMSDYQGDVCSWYDVPCHLSGFADWLLSLVLVLPQWIVEKLTDMAIFVVESIQLPADVLGAVGTAFAAAGPGAAYLAGVFALKEGLGMIFTAFGIRFLLRALPFSF